MDLGAFPSQSKQNPNDLIKSEAIGMQDHERGA